MMKRAPATNAKKRIVSSSNQQKVTKGKKPSVKNRIPPKSDPAFSLYSVSSDSENDDAQKLHKDLNKCAKLLSDMLEKDPKSQNVQRQKRAPRSKSKSRQEKRCEENMIPSATRQLPKQTNRSPLMPADNFMMENGIPTDRPQQMDHLSEYPPQPSTAFNHRLSSSTPEPKNYYQPHSAEAIRKEKLVYAVGGVNGYPSPHVSPEQGYPRPQHDVNAMASPEYPGYGQISNNIPHPASVQAPTRERTRSRSSTFPVDTETFKNLAEKHFPSQPTPPRPASVGPIDSEVRNHGLNEDFIPRDDYFLHAKLPSPNQRRVQFEFERPVRDTEGQEPCQNVQPAFVINSPQQENTQSFHQSSPFVSQTSPMAATFVSQTSPMAATQGTLENNQSPFISGIANVSHNSPFPSDCIPVREEQNRTGHLLTSDLRDDCVPDEVLSDPTPCPSVPLTPCPSIPPRHFDPVELRTQYATVKYLLGELRAYSPGDTEFKRIVTELETSINSMSPVKNGINLQAEIDLAVQPLRSENVQLRRRLRIVNQQLKERERKDKENTKPETNFEFAHLHAKYSSLQQKYNEEREKTSKLQNRIYQLEGDVEKVRTDKQKMMLTLSEKDTDQMKTRHDWLQETTKLKKDLESTNKRYDEMKAKFDATERERQLMSMSIQQRDGEVSRMQGLLHEFKLRYDPSRPQAPLSTSVSPAGQGTTSSRLTRQALEEFNKTNQPAEKMGQADGEMYVQRSPKIAEQDGSPYRSPLLEVRQSPQGFEGPVDDREKRRSPMSAHLLSNQDLNSKSKTVSFLNHHDDMSSMVSSVSEKMNQHLVSPSFARPMETKSSADSLTQKSEVSLYSRHSVTDYFNKYPQSRFRYTGSFNMESTRQETDLDTSGLSSVTSSFDDGKSIGSESTLTSSSVSSINSQDDRMFREGLANLDANIARLQMALKKTTVR